MNQSTDKREMALITGASSGIGAALARNLAARGYDLVLTARREDRLQALKTELAATGRRIEVIPEDLGAPGGAESLIRRIEALGLTITFLANNAGFGIHGNFVDHTPERIAQMLQLNIFALTTLTWHFARAMRSRGHGRILQVGSIGAYQPTPYYAPYAATKAYVLLFSEALNYELRGTGVTCTTINPGVTDTEFHDVAEHPKTGLAGMTRMSAESVAGIGINAALRGQAVVTPGLLNKLTALMTKLIPRSVATYFAGLLMRD